MSWIDLAPTDEPKVDVNSIYEDTKKAESVLNALIAQFEELESNPSAMSQLSEPSDEPSDELDRLMQENNKLKYRLSILKSRIDEEKIKLKGVLKKSAFTGVQDTLTRVCNEALTSAFPKWNIDQSVQSSTQPNVDYQFNAALQLTQRLKSEGKKVPPQVVAKEIVAKMPPCPLIASIDVAPQGFINICLSKDFCQEFLTKQVVEGIQPPESESRLRVVVDFSSPNIAKQMHVGHLRSTIIGDSICRLLEFLGHDVVRLNHVGDWGTQFGMLIAHLKDKFPDYTKKSPPIEDLQNFYKESKARFDSDEEFKRRAYECVVKLQQFDEDSIKGWNLICDASRKEFQQIYDRLDIKLTERGESYYQKHMEDLVKSLESQGFLEEDEGRKIMFGLETGQIPMTIVKSDGGFTYDTSDLAALKQRIEQEKADWIIYVTDVGQATHFKVLFSCAQKCGILDQQKVRVDHVGFGVVLGEDKKKFKTRSGETVKLSDLLDEGVKRAEEKLIEKNRHTVLTKEEFNKAKEAVAYGCIKYADISRNRTNDYIFSFDKMLEDKGNTAVYMLYALTRIRSIARNANISPTQLAEAAKTTKVPVNHEKEWNLVKVLLRLNDILRKITKDLCLHALCEYLYEIATAFTEFYDSCYCIEKDGKTGEVLKIHENRLLLCEATALVMEKCFEIIGLRQVSRM